MSSPSNRKTARVPRRTAATARRAITSKTGCTSVGEAEITLEDLGWSPSAARANQCSSRFRASSSVKRRAFSIAMTAWSAKVWSSAICVVRERTRLRRAPRRSPRSGSPSRSIGTAIVLRDARAERPRQDVRFGRIVRESARRVRSRIRARDEASVAHWASGVRAGPPRAARSASDETVTKWISSPSNRNTPPKLASHRRTPLSTIASNTG